MKITISANRQWDFLGNEAMQADDVIIEVEVTDGIDYIPVKLSNDYGAVYYIHKDEFLRLLRAAVMALE